MADAQSKELEDAHAVLADAMARVSQLRWGLNHAGVDTAFAVGEALGHLAKAKGLVGRDIDQARDRAKAVTGADTALP